MSTHAKHRLPQRIKAVIIDDYVEDHNLIIRAGEKNIPGISFSMKPEVVATNPQSHNTIMGGFLRPPSSLNDEEYLKIVTCIQNERPHLIFVDINSAPSGSVPNTNGLIALRAVEKAYQTITTTSGRTNMVASPDTVASVWPAERPLIVCCSNHLNPRSSNPEDARVFADFISGIGGVNISSVGKSDLRIGQDTAEVFWEKIWELLSNVYCPTLLLKSGVITIDMTDFFVARLPEPGADQMEVCYGTANSIFLTSAEFRTFSSFGPLLAGIPAVEVVDIFKKSHWINLLQVATIVAHGDYDYQILWRPVLPQYKKLVRAIILTREQLESTFSKVEKVIRDWNLERIACSYFGEPAAIWSRAKKEFNAK